MDRLTFLLTAVAGVFVMLAAVGVGVFIVRRLMAQSRNLNAQPTLDDTVYGTLIDGALMLTVFVLLFLSILQGNGSEQDMTGAIIGVFLLLSLRLRKLDNRVAKRQRDPNRDKPPIS